MRRSIQNAPLSEPPRRSGSLWGRTSWNQWGGSLCAVAGGTLDPGSKAVSLCDSGPVLCVRCCTAPRGRPALRVTAPQRAAGTKEEPACGPRPRLSGPPASSGFSLSCQTLCFCGTVENIDIPKASDPAPLIGASGPDPDQSGCTGLIN
ncbi:hypothetical protein EYF80_065048 [Liparis tanakae]|uniref:Uncharacterized protein n=1 Tax=Liparis tanakae TaxID=230148 RepID=A0A4Z2E7Q9_9TELE|nr:hypothetical protein EYF80_065048 [Liparis tanakae]